MRRPKVQMLAAVFAAAMMLGGCGEATYEITEKEEDIIVNYSAHVVAKYNTSQKSGLTYVSRELEETEEETEAIPEEPATELSQAPGEIGGTHEGNETLEAEGLSAGAEQASLSDLFGQDGLVFDYAGARLSDSYMEDTYYAMYPDAGKVYLILEIDITNEGAAAASVDYLTKQADFSAVLNGTVTASAESTLLTGDFSTFVGTLAAGETKETVLLFQVPSDTVSVDAVSLYVGAAEKNYQVILENE